MVKIKPKIATTSPAPLSDSNPPTPLENPNKMVYDFLKQNGLVMRVGVVEASGGFLGDGFLLDKKDILKVVFERV